MTPRVADEYARSIVSGGMHSIGMLLGIPELNETKRREYLQAAHETSRDLAQDLIDTRSDLAAAEAAAGEMRSALEKVRRSHMVLDEDCWYSCPASGECCNDNAGTRCDCGADAANAIIDAALAHDAGRAVARVLTAAKVVEERWRRSDEVELGDFVDAQKAWVAGLDGLCAAVRALAEGE